MILEVLSRISLVTCGSVKPGSYVGNLTQAEVMCVHVPDMKVLSVVSHESGDIVRS